MQFKNYPLYDNFYFISLKLCKTKRKHSRPISNYKFEKGSGVWSFAIKSKEPRWKSCAGQDWLPSQQNTIQMIFLFQWHTQTHFNIKKGQYLFKPVFHMPAFPFGLLTWHNSHLSSLINRTDTRTVIMWSSASNMLLQNIMYIKHWDRNRLNPTEPVGYHCYWH